MCPPSLKMGTWFYPCHQLGRPCACGTVPTQEELLVLMFSKVPSSDQASRWLPVLLRVCSSPYCSCLSVTWPQATFLFVMSVQSHCPTGCSPDIPEMLPPHPELCTLVPQWLSRLLPFLANMPPFHWSPNLK